MEREALIKAIAVKVQACGGRAMLVGGCVRDALLGRPSEDIDCEVYGLEPHVLREVARSFGEVDVSGERYGIFSLRKAGIDLAVPRREERVGPLHTDFSVTLDPFLAPKQAAARRDFTVNAILRDALTGEIVDPFGGRMDLERGILRAVPGGGFEEDPLRVLRGAQFCARFHLQPDDETLAQMRHMPLGSLTPARVMGETQKALLQSDRPEIYFDVLKKADALEPWFKELFALHGVMQNPIYHPEGDAYIHTMLVVHEAAAVRNRAEDPLAFMLAALVHDLGKAVSTKKNEKGAWQSVGHEYTGEPLAEKMLLRLGVKKQTVLYAKNMCRLHMQLHTCYYSKSRVGKTNRLFDASVCPQELGMLAVCDALGTGKPRENAASEREFVAERLQAYQDALKRGMPTGKMLMEAGAIPGPSMAKALQRARSLALGGLPAQTAAKEAVREMKAQNAVENQETFNQKQAGEKV